MNFTLPTSTAAVFLLASPLALEGIRFEPEAGTESSRVFSETTVLTLDSISMTAGGTELPSESVTMEVTQGRTVAVTDTYGETRDGAPASLSRVFGTVDASIEASVVTPDGDEEEVEITCEHPLDGKTVEFGWNPESERSEPRLPEGEALDEEWLEGLQADMDLASLLVSKEGSKEFEKGDRWLVDPESFLALTRPGGVGFVPLELGSNEQTLAFFFTALLSARDLLESPEGEVEMWWKNSREVDGHQCAVFDLDIELEGSRDVSSLLTGPIADLLPEEADQLGIFETIVCDVTLEGEGELVWNLDLNRLHSVELEVDNRTTLNSSGSDEDAGAEIELLLELEGTTTLAVTPQ